MDAATIANVVRTAPMPQQMSGAWEHTDDTGKKAM
jgi:hypothetical protein